MMVFVGGGTLVIGLTKGNIERLQTVNPATMTLPKPSRVEAFIVLYGEDKPDIIQQLELAGMQIPQAIKDDAKVNPQ